MTNGILLGVIHGAPDDRLGPGHQMEVRKMGYCVYHRAHGCSCVQPEVVKIVSTVHEIECGRCGKKGHAECRDDGDELGRKWQPLPKPWTLRNIISTGGDQWLFCGDCNAEFDPLQFRHVMERKKQREEFQDWMKRGKR